MLEARVARFEGYGSQQFQLPAFEMLGSFTLKTRILRKAVGPLEATVARPEVEAYGDLQG